MNGILIADTGQWFHKAQFRPNVRMDVEFLSFCGGARKDLVCATYAWSKMKKRVGSNLGKQGLVLSGTRAAGSAGGDAPIITYEERVSFGFRLEGGTFTWMRRGQDLGSTASKKALKKLDSGMVGLVWNGRISAAIPKITIVGHLDLEWAGKQVKSIGKRYAEFQKKNKADKKKRGR